MGSRGNQIVNTAYKGQATVLSHISTNDREEMIRQL